MACVDRVMPASRTAWTRSSTEAAAVQREDVEAATARWARTAPTGCSASRIGDRPLRVLTHCNTGSLATAAWGTALGVIRELHARDRLELVYADETRPCSRARA